MSVILSFGKYGGWYWHSGFSKRICLGWVSLTYIPMDIDALLLKCKEDRR